MCASSDLQINLPTRIFSSVPNLIIGHMSTGKYKEQEIFKQSQEFFFSKKTKHSTISAPDRIRSTMYNSIEKKEEPNNEYNLSDISDFDLCSSDCE